MIEITKKDDNFGKKLRKIYEESKGWNGDKYKMTDQQDGTMGQQDGTMEERDIRVKQ